MTRKISLTVNGVRASHEVEPRLLLVHYLRDMVGLTGTHIGCDTSQCGACTVMFNGVAVKSCTILAVQADGARSAMRLLHAGHDHDRASIAAAQPRSLRSRNSSRA